MRREMWGLVAGFVALGVMLAGCAGTAAGGRAAGGADDVKTQSTTGGGSAGGGGLPVKGKEGGGSTLSSTVPARLMARVAYRCGVCGMEKMVVRGDPVPRHCERPMEMKE